MRMLLIEAKIVDNKNVCRIVILESEQLSQMMCSQLSYSNITITVQSICDAH